MHANVLVVETGPEEARRRATRAQSSASPIAWSGEAASLTSRSPTSSTVRLVSCSQAFRRRCGRSSSGWGVEARPQAADRRRGSGAIPEVSRARAGSSLPATGPGSRRARGRPGRTAGTVSAPELVRRYSVDEGALALRGCLRTRASAPGADIVLNEGGGLPRERGGIFIPSPMLPPRERRGRPLRWLRSRVDRAGRTAVQPPPTTSGSAPAVEQATGQPQAIASSGGCPNPS